MRVEGTLLSGVVLLHGASHSDDRGRVRKVSSLNEIRDDGIEVVVDQVLTTDNPDSGTVRGLHYQAAPHEESKTLWVTRGALFDVLVDLRPSEPTFGTWLAVRLHAHDDVALHVPIGIAHGYQTLEPNTSLTYLIRGIHSPPHARTLLWNDADLDIAWPLTVTHLSDKDREGTPWRML